MLVQCDCIVWVLELVCVIWVTNSMLFYHPLSFYFEIMVLLQQHHLSTFKWHCWCQCLKTRLKHLTLEWKLARRESSWLWMQLVWERALYKIQETTWSIISADCCPPTKCSLAFAFISAGKFVLRFVTFAWHEVFGMLPFHKMQRPVLEASCLDALLSSSLLPPQGLSPAPTLPVPAPSQALTSKARSGGHRNQSPHCWAEATVTMFRIIRAY